MEIKPGTWSSQTGGLTLRDYFAGLALAGLIVAVPRMPNEVIARQAYHLADAMIAEREAQEREEK